MKKYWTIFKLELQKDMQYRFNFLISILSNAIILIFFFYFWIRIYSEGNRLGSYDLKTLLTYYLFSIILAQVLFRETAWVVSEEISEGGMNTFLLKPLSYITNHIMKYLGSFMAAIAHYAPFVILAAFFLRKQFIYPLSFIQWIFFIMSFSLAASFYFLIFYCMGLASFWVERIWGLSYGFMVFSNFMAGRLLPIDLFPLWFIKVSDCLPFKYMLYEPISIFLNKIPFNWQSLFIPLGWVVILGFVSHIVWKRGVRVYEAYGA
ncbi:MAG: ABC-2 family transporter protein [bacterium]